MHWYVFASIPSNDIPFMVYVDQAPIRTTINSPPPHAKNGEVAVDLCQVKFIGIVQPRLTEYTANALSDGLFKSAARIKSDD